MSKKYVNNECTFCGGSLAPIIPQDPTSNMKCIKCGAIFYNLSNFESEHPGEFTGRYAPVSKDRRYENSWGKNYKPIINNNKEGE